MQEVAYWASFAAVDSMRSGLLRAAQGCENGSAETLKETFGVTHKAVGDQNLSQRRREMHVSNLGASESCRGQTVTTTEREC